jgi:hypothetical protein
MTLSPADEAVLASLKHGHAAQIDSLNLLPEWLESEPARAATAAALQLARLGKRVDIVNIRIHPLARHIPRDAWGPVVHVFTNGHKDVAPQDAVQAAHDAYVTREGEKITGEMTRMFAHSRHQAPKDLLNYAQRVNALYSGAKVEKFRPSDIYEEDAPEVKFTSKIPQVNEMLGGGYRNGMLWIYLGAPGHGKTSALRTDAANGILQQKRVVYLVTENSTVKALHGILRALTGLTEQEIAKRAGNTPEREDIRKAWLKWCDQYLMLYGQKQFTVGKIERILACDKPDLLLIDYLRKDKGMTDERGFVEDPVGDFAYKLLDFTNHFGVAIGTAAQMSAENAKKFEAGKYMESAPAAYGTDRPRQAADLYIGVRRSKTAPNYTNFFKWKDRFGNPIHTSWDLPFDTQRQALAWPANMH